MRGGSLSFIFPPPPSRKRIGRTSGIVRDETRSGRVWRTLSFSACLPSCYFFFDMQAFSSPPPRSEIVPRVAMGGWCDDGNPISIWTITLPSGLAVHLFQFDWLGEPCSPKQPAQPLYSGHQAQARGLMGLVHFTGIQLLWPKYANTFKVGPWPKQWVNRT